MCANKANGRRRNQLTALVVCEQRRFTEIVAGLEVAQLGRFLDLGVVSRHERLPLRDYHTTRAGFRIMRQSTASGRQQRVHGMVGNDIQERSDNPSSNQREDTVEFDAI